MGEVVIDNTDDVRKYRGIPVYIATVYYRWYLLRIPRPGHLVDHVIS